VKVQPNPEAAQPGPHRPSPDAQDKKFSKVLEQKRDPSAADEKRAAERKRERGVHDEDEQERASSGEQPSMFAFDGSGAAAAAIAARTPVEPVSVKEAAGAAPVQPAVVNGLVAEISAVVEPGAAATVDIRFDSKTLAGLQVHVVKAGEHISVRFNTNAENVAALLTRNTDSLTAALQARGFQVGAVTVVSDPKPASGEPDPRGRSGSPGGRQQERGGRERRRQ
jgi:hypothetical protein